MFINKKKIKVDSSPSDDNIDATSNDHDICVFVKIVFFAELYSYRSYKFK